MMPEDTESLYKSWFKSGPNVAFLAGGLAGAVSRTVVSPFDRVKIILQVQSDGAAYNQGLFAAIGQVYREEGTAGLFRGNGLNCIRIFPYSAVQFVVYEFCKRHFFHVTEPGQQLTNPQRLFSGALCGGASVVATYPLDLVRTRLSVQTANLHRLQSSEDTRAIIKGERAPPGVWQLLKQIYREEGRLAGLYRGVYPTSLGVVPYVALNFALYEQLKELAPSTDASYALGSLYKLGLGAISGGVAQTLTYPFDLLRRRFQVLSMNRNALGFHYKSVPDALRVIYKQEGYRGYYKGLTANLFKVVPSTAVSWLVYEVARDFIMQC